MFLFLGSFKVLSNPKTDSLILVLVRAIEKKDVSVKADFTNRPIETKAGIPECYLARRKVLALQCHLQ